IDAMLPKDERPQHTEGYEGYYHLTSISGDVESVSMHYLIRDHSREIFENRKQKMRDVVEKICEIYGKDVVTIDLHDNYYNMREVIEKKMEVVDVALHAMKKIGIDPIVRPIRGGTDGSRLSFMGVPTPNIFAGGENFHSRCEFLPCNSLKKVSQLIVEIVKSI
ncbi:MAG: peptidase T, partial [Rikenellaceae bacterium]